MAQDNRRLRGGRKERMSELRQGKRKGEQSNVALQIQSVASFRRRNLLLAPPDQQQRRGPRDEPRRRCIRCSARIPSQTLRCYSTVCLAGMQSLLSLTEPDAKAMRQHHQLESHGDALGLLLPVLGGTKQWRPQGPEHLAAGNVMQKCISGSIQTPSAECDVTQFARQR